jgi:hypothetical protein
LQTVRKVGLQVNHSGQLNGPPPAHHYETQFLHDRFGPSLFELSTKHLIIGGYLRWYSELICMDTSERITYLVTICLVTWTAYLQPFKILDITIEVIQQVQIRPSTDVVGPIERHELRRTIYRLTEDDHMRSHITHLIKPGEEYANISRQIRVPFDEGPFILASHHPDTQSCITDTSELVLNITFEQYEGGEIPTEEQLRKPSRQLMQIKCPAIFSSCFCRLEHSKLPAYTPADDVSLSRQSSAQSGKSKGKYGMSQCMCTELGEEEEKEYGVSREEVYERWKAEEAGRAWLETVRQKTEQHGTVP